MFCCCIFVGFFCGWVVLVLGFGGFVRFLFAWFFGVFLVGGGQSSLTGGQFQKAVLVFFFLFNRLEPSSYSKSGTHCTFTNRKTAVRFTEFKDKLGRFFAYSWRSWNYSCSFIYFLCQLGPKPIETLTYGECLVQTDVKRWILPVLASGPRSVPLVYSSLWLLDWFCCWLLWHLFSCLQAW